MIKFPDRKPRGRTKPEAKSDYHLTVGSWNRFLMAFIIAGAIVMIVAESVMYMLGM